MKKAIDMTRGNPFRLMVSFTIPMILGNVFQQCYTMVDTMVVGRFVSKDALAAVGATGAIMYLMISVIIGFAVGTAIVTAQYAGAKNTAGIRAIFATDFHVVVIESVVLCIIGNLGLRPALVLLNTPPELLDQADLYLRINFSTCVAPILYNLVSQFMRSLGDSKTPLVALIISSVANIVLDLVFVIVFHMGVAGVAIATAVSQAISAVYCLVVTWRRFPEYIPGKGQWRADINIIRTILRFGIPMSLQNMLISFGMMYVQAIINSFGTNVVAGYTAGNKVDQIGLQFMASLGTAVSTYTGQNYGARHRGRLTEGLKASLLLDLILAAFLGLVILLLRRPLVGLFMESTETEAIDTALQYLSVISAFYLLCGLSNILQSYLRGINYAAIPTISSLVQLAVKMGVAALLSARLGSGGIWWAWPVSWAVTDLMLVAVCVFYAAPRLNMQSWEDQKALS